jgi:tRNA/tmRNA/rRNA uracil-C5-methylase (TrmA/RlmC/RlmD family)
MIRFLCACVNFFRYILRSHSRPNARGRSVGPTERREHGANRSQRRPLSRLAPGAFLQATEAGEEVLASRVCAQVAGLKRIADLFSGIGTFSLRMAEFAAVSAFDIDERALSAEVLFPGV